jgi:hypothetical protein
MTKLKNKRQKVKRGMVRGDTIFPLCSQFDGEWYATITARYAAEDAEPIIVIAGPFADVEEAKAHNRKWLEASSRLGQYYFIGMASVPAKVRQRITNDVLRGWRQGDFERLRSWRGGDDIRVDLAPKN